VASPPKQPFQVLARFLERAPEDEINAMKFRHESPEDIACRVLRARKFDVEAALVMLKATKMSSKHLLLSPLLLLSRPSLVWCPPSADALYLPPSVRVCVQPPPPPLILPVSLTSGARSFDLTLHVTRTPTSCLELQRRRCATTGRTHDCQSWTR
jgi:hypothetical protein